MSIGQLLQPFAQVVWGGKNLSSYDDGTGNRMPMAQNVRMTLTKERSAPECTFSIYPNPQGFQLFSDLKSSSIDEPFEISFGYPESKSFKQSFKFAGVGLATGANPQLNVTGVSAVKGCWTDTRISYTMEEEISLKEFPDFLKKQIGECAKEINIEFDGQALEAASEIKIKHNQIQRTPHVILVNVMRAQGMEVTVGSSADKQATIVISYAFNLDGESERAQPNPAGGSAGGSSPTKRTIYIVGPHLMTTAQRTQKFNLGSESTKAASSKDDRNVNETDTQTIPQPQDASPQSEAVADEGREAPTIGNANPSDSQTGTTEDGSLTKEARVKLSQIITTEIQLTVPMLPYMVGVRPRDILAIPSLKGPGNFIEDWEITSVQYSQDPSGGIQLQLQGQRPYIGEETLMDEGSQAKVKAQVARLQSLEAWEQFYWSGG